MSTIDLRPYVKISQAGSNTCFYDDNVNTYLWIENKIITSPIIKKTLIDNNYYLIETKNHKYIIPPHLSIYHIDSLDSINFNKLKDNM